MVKRFKGIVGIAFCLLLGGCNEAALMKRWTPPEAEAVAREYVDLLRQGKFDQIEHDLDPSLVDSSVQDTLATMAAYFPDENPTSVKVVGVNVNRSAESSTTNIMLEYQFKDQWILVSFATQMTGDARTIVGFHVNPLSDSLENLNRFTLVGKSPQQYWVLVFGVCSMVFSIYVFLVCIRTKDVKLKWLWMPFILCGIGKAVVNWTTGQWDITPLSVQIPCLMATAPLYGPWTVATALPLGAILFWARHRNMRARVEQLEPSATQSAARSTPEAPAPPHSTPRAHEIPPPPSS